MVDWDLEAPGLERYFPSLELETILQRHGMVDMLLQYKNQMANENNPQKPFTPQSPSDYIVDVYPKNKGKGKLHLLTAGRRAKIGFANYVHSVQTFDWQEFYEVWEGEIYFNWLREEFENIADIVLIDSRTGVSEMVGVCTYHLADVIVMFCAPNQQNLAGTQIMAQNFKSPEVSELRGGRDLLVLTVPTRIERAESNQLDKFQKQFFDSLSEFTPNIKGVDIRQLWSIRIPYIPKYAYSEQVAARDPQASDEEMFGAYLRLFNMLKHIRESNTDAQLLETNREFTQIISDSVQAAFANQYPLSAKLLTWLEMLGLRCNPFDAKYLDAGADPNLSSYLIGHDAFMAIRQDQPPIVIAPIGGGKTALRARLARACRVDEGGRRILPVVYTLPRPQQLTGAATVYERHLHYISHCIGIELLFALAYRPQAFLELRALDRRRVASQLAATFPGDLSLQLEQIAGEGELLSLVQLIDPSVDRLIAVPTAERLRTFCTALSDEVRAAERQITDIQGQPTQQRFQNLMALTKQTLNFQAIYLLVDGVDAYVEVTTNGRRRLGELLTPLLQQTSDWAAQQLYAKYFLPNDLLTAIKFSELLQPGKITDLKFVSIEWTRASLNDVLQERLRFASEGRFTNLDAICAPTLRGVQAQILEAAAPLPRDVLALAEQLLLTHVARLHEPALLEPTDLETAISHYQNARARQGVAL